MSDDIFGLGGSHEAQLQAQLAAQQQNFGAREPGPKWLDPIEEPQPTRLVYLWIGDGVRQRRATAEDLEKLGFVRKVEP